MAKLVDAIRQAIDASSVSRYRIAKDTGVSAGQLSRLVNSERSITADTIETLADYLGLEIIIRPKTKTKGK